MNRFHITVIIVASIIFVITLLYFITQYGEMNKIYPPVATDCPDYWTVNKDGTCNIPTDGNNLGTLNGQEIYTYIINNATVYSYLPQYYSIVDKALLDGTLYKVNGNNVIGYYKSDIPAGYNPSLPQNNRIDFNDPSWALGGTSECGISKWAKIHNVAWDGMTNYNVC